MAENKKRHGHPYRKPADIPANERVKGKTFWAILLAVFGLLIAWLAAGKNYPVLIISTAGAAVLGWLIGMRMEKEK